MTQAERRTGTGSGTYAGKEMYEYCLSCDGAMSVWKTFGAGSATYPTSWRRYEYDGLNVLRVDERCDDDVPTNGIDDQDPWRVIEVNTHKPGSLDSLIGKRVYTYGTVQTDDFSYTYDAVGNVVAVYNAEATGRGNELYYFTQDAFGNELTTSPFSGSSWATARAAGITEHQTGKWKDSFTDLYYFHARWYDSTVGRFVSRDPQAALIPFSHSLEEGSYCCDCMQYTFVGNSPLQKTDPTGALTFQACTRGKASPGMPGNHCFLCWDATPIWKDEHQCFGCQMSQGHVKEKWYRPPEKYDCVTRDVDLCTMDCIKKTFEECCSKFKRINPPGWLIYNCCDCARRAPKKCGLKVPPNMEGINCGF